jgi:hypothetical protein
MQIKRVTAADADSVGRLAFELFAELAAPAGISARSRSCMFVPRFELNSLEPER